MASDMRLRHAPQACKRAQPTCEFRYRLRPSFYGHCCRNFHRIPRRKAAKRAPFHSRRRETRSFSSVLLAAHVLGPDASILIILIGIVVRLPGISNANHHAALAVGTVAVNGTGDG